MQCLGRISFTIVAIGLLASTASAANLIDYWAFEEGAGTTLVNGVSGRPAATMENFAGTEWTDIVPAELAHSEGALSFAGGTTNQRLLLATRDDYNGGTGEAFSVSMWLNVTDDDAADMRLFLQKDLIQEGTAYTNLVSAVHFDMSGSINQAQAYGTAWNNISPVTAGTWQNWIFIFENNTLKTYVDGALASTTSGYLWDCSAVEMQIGGQLAIHWANGTIATYGTSYHGLMDDVSVWDDALTETEIAALADGANPIPEPSAVVGLLLMLLSGLFLRRRVHR